MKLQWNKRTLIYGGGIALLVILFLVLRSGSASGATVVQGSSGPSDAQIAAQTQLQLAQIGAAEKASEASANYNIATMQIQGDLDKAQIEANLVKYQTDAQNDAQKASTAAAAQAAHDQLEYQAQTTEYLGNLQASVTKYQLDNALAIQNSNNAFQLDYAEAANQTQLSLGQLQAQIVAQQVAANRDTTIAQLTTARDITTAQLASNQAIVTETLQTQADALAAQLNANVAINDSNNNKDISIADIEGRTARKQSHNNMIGGIVGAVGGLLGGIF